MKLCLEKGVIETYSRNNKEKSVVNEKCVRTSKNQIYKYMTSISKNGYTDQ